MQPPGATALMFSQRTGDSENNNWCTCGRSAAGSASPCQGEGRGFESRRPLGGTSVPSRTSRSGCPRLTGEVSGGVAEWLRQGPAKPCTRVRFPPPPRAISSAGEHYLDTVGVTGSIPVSRTSNKRPGQGLGQSPLDRAFVFAGCVSGAFPEHGPQTGTGAPGGSSSGSSPAGSSSARRIRSLSSVRRVWRSRVVVALS